MKLVRLLLCIVPIITFQVQASLYTITAYNRTTSDIRLLVSYAGETSFSCRPDDIVVPAKSSVKIDAYGCCINRFFAQGVNGSLVNKTFINSFGMSCGSFNIDLKQNGGDLDCVLYVPGKNPDYRYQ